MEITGWHYAQLIDIVNKCPVARAEQGNSAPTAEDEVGTTLEVCEEGNGWARQATFKTRHPGERRDPLSGLNEWRYILSCSGDPGFRRDKDEVGE